MIETIEVNLRQAVAELLESAELKEDDILVLGCSTSEIIGEKIGQHSSLEVGELVVATLLDVLQNKGIHLAVQGCEHLNRALTVERKVALAHDFEIVSVVPDLHAGGACSVVAYQRFNDPVLIEHIIAQASIDIGDTSTGMHVKFVQVPVRTSIKTIGHAHVTYLKSRPKLIGGPRAKYEFMEIR